MHCVRFEMRLNELLDERASPAADRELLDHAQDCPECAELLAGHELLVSGLRRLEPAVSPDFSVRVAAQFADESRRWRTRWIGSITAIAAGLLLAVGILHILNSPAGDRSLPGDRVVNDQRPLDSNKAGPRASSQLYAQEIINFGDEVRQRIGQQRPEWVTEVADGLKPVADSMSAALHALRRTLPRGEAPVRSSQFEPAVLKVADIA